MFSTWSFQWIRSALTQREPCWYDQDHSIRFGLFIYLLKARELVRFHNLFGEFLAHINSILTKPVAQIPFNESNRKRLHSTATCTTIPEEKLIIQILTEHGWPMFNQKWGLSSLEMAIKQLTWSGYTLLAIYAARLAVAQSQHRYDQVDTLLKSGNAVSARNIELDTQQQDQYNACVRKLLLTVIGLKKHWN